MRRRAFIAGIAGLGAAWPLVAHAQQPAHIPRIGLLMPVSGAAAAPNIDAFRQGLRELGYVEGRGVAFEYRFADGREAAIAEFAAELVRLPVAVIFAALVVIFFEDCR